MGLPSGDIAGMGNPGGENRASVISTCFGVALNAPDQVILSESIIGDDVPPLRLERQRSFPVSPLKLLDEGTNR